MTFEAGSVDLPIRVDLSQLTSELRRGESATHAAARVMERDLQGVQRAFDSAGAAAGQAAGRYQAVLSQVTSLQARINASVGIRGTDVAARTRDIVAYGTELDRLRAKFNPIFAASKQYEAELGEINRAHRVGAITLQEQARAVELLNERYRTAATSVNVMNLATGQSAANMRILSFQLFDIGQSAALAFQSPLYFMQNFAIQTGQIAQQYQGQGGLRQALVDTRTLLGGLAQGARRAGTALLAALATPTGLVAAGFVAVGVAVAGTMAIIASRLPSAQRALSVHEETIKRIRAAWEDAREGPEKYGQAVQAAIAFSANRDLREQQRLLQQQLRGNIFGSGGFSLFGDVPVDEALRKLQLLGTGIALALTPAQRGMASFQATIADFRREIAEGTPDVLAFRSEVQRIANLDPTNRALQAAAQRLLDISAAAAETAARLRDVNREFDELTLRTARTAAAANIRKYIQENADALVELQKQRQAALAGVAARSPGELAAAARARVLAEPINPDESPAVRQYRAETAAATAYAQALRGLTDAQQQRARSIANSLETARQEIALIGAGVQEQTRLRTETQLLQQAKDAAAQAGTIVSPEEVAMIRAAAAELGALAEQRARLNLRADLLFERAQLFRTETEQRVAEAMRGIFGDEYLSRMDSFEANLIRMNDRLSAARDIAKSFISEFYGGLRRGEGVWASFANAANSALDRIVDKLLGDVIDAVFRVATAAGGGGAGGGGGLFGFLGRLLGGGGGNLYQGTPLVGAGLFHAGVRSVGQTPATQVAAPAALFARAPRLHYGLGPDEFPAILQRGEEVRSRAQVANGNRPTSIVVQNIDQSSRGVSIENEVSSGPGGELILRSIIRDEVSSFAQTSKGRAAMSLPTRRAVGR